MKKLLFLYFILIPIAGHSEIGVKLGVNQINFQNKSIQTKPNFSIGLRLAKSKNKKFFFSYELLYSKIDASFKNVAVCRDPESIISGTFSVNHLDINLYLDYNDINILMNYQNTLFDLVKFVLYCGPSIAFNTKLKSNSTLLRTEQFVDVDNPHDYYQYTYGRDTPVDLRDIYNSGLYLNFGTILTRGIIDIDFRYSITSNKISARNISLKERVTHLYYFLIGIHLKQ